MGTEGRKINKINCPSPTTGQRCSRDVDASSPPPPPHLVYVPLFFTIHYGQMRNTGTKTKQKSVISPPRDHPRFMFLSSPVRELVGGLSVCLFDTHETFYFCTVLRTLQNISGFPSVTFCLYSLPLTVLSIPWR